MKFIKKHREKKINVKVIATCVVAITLIGIVGISVLKFSGSDPINHKPVSDSVTSTGKGINSVFSKISGTVGEVFKFRSNAIKSDKLEKENEKLKKDVIDLNGKLKKVESLTELKKSLNFVKEQYVEKKISTSVVEKNDGDWFDSVVLGAGGNAGVKKGSIVVNGKGLVGLVYEVSKNYSKAITLADSKSAISFKLVKNNDFKGVITKNTNINYKMKYDEKGYLKGYMFDSSYNVSKGDVVVTSGLGVYPEGIPIGKVVKVVDDKNISLKSVVVKPFADFKNISDVVVINPRNIQEGDNK